jgi:ABC-type uncharacterized transport system substrate-binding protein
MLYKTSKNSNSKCRKRLNIVDKHRNLVYSRSREKELKFWQHLECYLHFMGGNLIMGKKTTWLTVCISLIFALVIAGCGGTSSPSAVSDPTAKPVDTQASQGNNPLPAKKLKILHIMSFNSPWEWTDTQFAGFKEQLKDLDIEYQVFQMDTKKNNTDELKEKLGKEARALIDSWKPDLVYTSDDDAQQFVTKHYMNSDIPFVFSGVNQTPDFYGFEKAKNITGVLETEHFVESVNLLKEIVPNMKKVAIIYDDGPQWIPMVARMKDREKQLEGIEVVAYDKILTYDEYKKKMKDYHGKVDAIGLIGIFNFKNEAGQNVPYDEVLKWTAENSHLPDFTFWKDRISFGTLSAMTVSGPEQGKAAGKVARQILVDGKKPSEIPMEPTAKGEPVINQARANQLNLKINTSLLLSVQIEKKYAWEK